jgi:hypothetical protein
LSVKKVSIFEIPKKGGTVQLEPFSLAGRGLFLYQNQRELYRIVDLPSYLRLLIEQINH